MKLKIKNNVFIFYFFVAIGLLTSVLVFFVLPPRFFLDTNTYVNDPYNEIGYTGGYPITILFYKITGLKYLHFSIIGFIQYFILALILYKIGIPKSFAKLNLKNFLVYFGLIVMAIFLSMPTKEFIAYLFTALIVFLYKNKKRSIRKTVIISLLLILFFGIKFREYYILLAVLSVLFFLFNKIRFYDKNVINIIFGVLMLICLSLSYGVLKGEFISQSTRETLNSSRNTETNSMIISPIDTDSWYGESLGIVYGFFSVNIPLNAFKHITSPQILVFSIWQLFLFIILFIKFGKSLNTKKEDPYQVWLFYFLFSYFIIQGVFEPDLGSAIRHKAGIFPLIYFLLYYDELGKKLS
ncbi:hypothetical protein FPF71_00800 [Algibacter amylolyticus]|uniref:Uncharacterized protein n=1 Tax=Algibacter amylolyticus TaxID=1608400 RepID=A0A5M7BCI9_9FLAO|nr:hypothetical protein [Algibacter amylolyticus]KAA5827416.1 hypothetical protein F2B50_00800 [Algibacter amylolyticus]MBB5266608.1 hypothetical protein [Algibacter amylolyticus]TSJ81661.1 hypothetical protein FPF71_00800 [Algibacter amylolyticus]